MSLTTFNGQATPIDSIVVPGGKNIASGSPSLTPTAGGLSQDVAHPGILFVGDGSNWIAVGGGGGTGDDFNDLAVTLTTAAANPNFTGCSLYMQRYENENTGRVMVMFQLTINNTSAGATTPDTWGSSVGLIPVDFRPAINLFFPIYATQGGALVNGSACCIIGSGGSISVRVTTAATADVAVIQASGVYQVV